jgi:hypothetical protein
MPREHFCIFCVRQLAEKQKRKTRATKTTTWTFPGPTGQGREEHEAGRNGSRRGPHGPGRVPRPLPPPNPLLQSNYAHSPPARRYHVEKRKRGLIYNLVAAQRGIWLMVHRPSVPRPTALPVFSTRQQHVTE